MTSSTLSTERLDYALAYARLGWRIFPAHSAHDLHCSCGDPTCRSIGKHPRIDRWQAQATDDERRIRLWWEDLWPEANLALVLGDGLIDVEDDPRHDGDEHLPHLEAILGPLPDTVSWTSGGGGTHRLYTVPPGVRVRCRTDLGRDLLGLGPEARSGVDCKADGGYAIVPPSSHAFGTRYRFGNLNPSDIDCAPLPEAWLAYLTQEPAALATAPTMGSDIIPEGRRNSTLTRFAGHLRRCGMDGDEIAAGLTAINAGRCRPPLDAAEVQRIAASVARYEPDQVTQATVEDWAATILGTKPSPHDPPSIGALFVAKPALRPPLIDGILRLGETMNVIAAPKVGKSWLVIDLALAVATGRPWLGYATQQRDVLILDNELHGETSAHRIPKVAAARGLLPEDYQDRVFVENLRGRLTDLLSMASYFDRIPAGRYGLIVLDAFYRFLPAGSDENDNGSMASLYNAIDRHADRLGCCFALIHHSSKGNQSGKAVTDVGAGAGAQSRATDTHLVLRPHEEPDAVVLDAAVRSWPPINAQVLRWEFPVWHLATDLDPADLRRERPRRKKEQTVEALTPERLAADLLGPEPCSQASIIEAALAAGASERRAQRLLTIACERGLAYRRDDGSYATAPQEQLTGREGALALLTEHPDLSAAAIARRCGVTRQYVHKLRAELADQTPPEPCQPAVNQDVNQRQPAVNRLTRVDIPVDNVSRCPNEP